MQDNVVVQGGEKLFLEDLLAGQLLAPTLALFINDVNPGKTAVLASFTPPTFVTSTPVALTFGPEYINADGDWEMVSQLVQFNFVSGGPEIVYGILVRSADGGTPLLLYARLDVPKSMGTVGDVIAIVVRFTLSGEGWGISVEVT